jgi:hypothetical protein
MTVEMKRSGSEVLVSENEVLNFYESASSYHCHFIMVFSLLCAHCLFSMMNSSPALQSTISSHKDNQGRESDELVLSFNIQDVIFKLLADYDLAMEPNTVTCSEVIGVS